MPAGHCDPAGLDYINPSTDAHRPLFLRFVRVCVSCQEEMNCAIVIHTRIGYARPDRCSLPYGKRCTNVSLAAAFGAENYTIVFLGIGAAFPWPVDLETIDGVVMRVNAKQRQ